MSVSVDSVVSTMLTSGGQILVREKNRIAANLGIASLDSNSWFTAHIIAVIDSRDLFTRMLENWVVRNGREANLGRLTNIMKEMQFLAVAEDISILGDSETLIVISVAQQPQSSGNTKSSLKQEKRLLRAAKWKQYKVEEFLGSGSYGFVFKIQKNPEAMPSAVKIVVVVPESNLSSDAARDEVIQANKEIQAMKALPDHVNVVQLLNCDVLYPTSINLLEHYGDAVGLRQKLQSSTSRQTQMVLGYYLTSLNLSSTLITIVIEMELCGHTLREWLCSDDTIRQMQNRSEQFARFQFNIAQGIINGLKHLHDNRMMHRGLKPENIYFSYVNSTDRFALPVKVGDLGLTRQISEQRTSDLTHTEPRGTVMYRAKEVNSGLYGRQADLFSLGLVLWEVFDVIQYNDIKRKFEYLTIDRHKSLIKQNPWVPNLVDTIFNLTYRDQEKRTKSIDDIKLEFKSQLQESSDSE